MMNGTSENLQFLLLECGGCGGGGERPSRRERERHNREDYSPRGRPDVDIRTVPKHRTFP